jgi:hypothetical protein
MTLTRGQWWRLGFVAAATSAYFGLTFAAPRGTGGNPYHLSVVLILVLGLTIVGLLLLAWWFGFYAWLELDRYTKRLPKEEGRRTYGRMATGVWFLVTGLILSSLMSAAKPLYAGDVGVATVITQVNYYTIIIFPFLGFMWLRIGSRHLAVSAQAMMSVRSKLVTVGPPVLLLAMFYVFLAATNSAPDTEVLQSGPTGFLVLPTNIILVVGSWVLGLLAALNIERATHRGESARLVRPLAKLYNGILTMTGAFIVLDALMSLGNTRLQALPVGVIVLLIYGFIGVVALGFLIVARGARELIAAAPAEAQAEAGGS